MVALNPNWLQSREDNIARVTDAAYHAVLERGYRGSFLELELSLWNAIRQAVSMSLEERAGPRNDMDRPLAISDGLGETHPLARNHNYSGRAKLSSCASGSTMWKKRSPHGASCGPEAGDNPAATARACCASTSSTWKITRPHRHHTCSVGAAVRFK